MRRSPVVALLLPSALLACGRPTSDLTPPDAGIEVDGAMEPDTGSNDPCANAGEEQGDRIATAENIDQLSRARAVTGTLTVSAEVRDLGSFRCLERVGTLVLEPNEQLSSAGFPVLQEVSVDLRVHSSRVFTSSSAFPELRSVGRDLRLSGIAPAFDGPLPRLESIGGMLTTQGIDRLHLEALVHLGRSGLSVGDLRELELPNLSSAGELLLVAAHRLERVSLPRLRTVTATISVVEDASLLELDLDSLESAGDLVISSNAMQPVIHMRSLSVVRGRLQIDGANVALLSFGSLMRVGGALLYSGNTGQAALLAPRLEEIGGILGIGDSPGLQTVALQALRRCDGVVVQRSAQLVSVELLALSSARQGVALLNNPALETFAASITSSASGGLNLSGNARLTSLRGLESVRVLGHVSLIMNPRLSALDLSALEEVGGSFRVEGTFLQLPLLVPNLRVAGQVAFSGDGPSRGDFPRLEQVERMTLNDTTDLVELHAPLVSALAFLQAYQNQALSLVDLPALGRLNAAQIVSNPAWSTCDIEALLDQVRSREGIQGETDIRSNGPCAD